MGCPQRRSGDHDVLGKAASGQLRAVCWRKGQLWAISSQHSAPGNGWINCAHHRGVSPFPSRWPSQTDLCPQINFNTFDSKGKMLGLCYISPYSFSTPVYIHGYKQRSRWRYSAHLPFYPLLPGRVQAPDTQGNFASKAWAPNEGWAGKFLKTGSPRRKSLICGICQFLWCTCSLMVNDRIP